MLKRHRLGLDGEAIAAERLAQSGYKIIGRRFACRRGDIDLVCRQGDAIVLVEVKTRASAAFGSGADVISDVKRRALAACAAEYRAMTGWRGPIRFLLASIRLGYGGAEVGVELLTDAIG